MDGTTSYKDWWKQVRDSAPLGEAWDRSSTKEGDKHLAGDGWYTVTRSYLTTSPICVNTWVLEYPNERFSLAPRNDYSITTP